MTDSTKQLTESDLAGFTGSMTWYRHWSKRILYTDGIKYLAENAGGGAFWLIDAVASHAMSTAQEPFVVWTLERRDNDTWRLTARADSGLPALVQQDIDYSDFPIDRFEFYVCHGEDSPVMMLKSEY